MSVIEIIQIQKPELKTIIGQEMKTQFEAFFNQKLNLNEKPKGKEFLSRKETSEFFGVSLVCLHDWMKKGIVKPYKMGNRTYFKHEELVQSLLNSNKVA